MTFRRVASRVVYENAWLRFEAHEIVHPNGRPGEHGLVVTPASVAVVVVDGDATILTRQTRFAADRDELEIVKGGAAAGEPRLAAAQRELREEIGVLAARWDDLGICYEIPSIVTPAIQLYLARELTNVAPEQEDVESIVAVRLPFADAYAAAARGEIADAVTGVALLRAAYAMRAEAGVSPAGATSRSRDVRAGPTPD